MLNNTKFKTSIPFTSNTENGTVSGEHGVKPKYQLIYELLPIAIVIVLTNSVVLFLFAKRKRLRTPNNCLLLSLSLCDLMTGFIGIPLFLTMVTTTMVMRVIKPPASVNFVNFVLVFNNTLAISAAYHILAITLERYFSIMKPFVHRQLTKKSILKVALFVWFASVVIAFMPYAWFSKKLTDPVSYKKTQFGYIVFCLSFVFLFPCILIVVSQFLMFRAIAKRGQCALTVTGTAKHKVRNEKKCLIIFLSMAIIYLACWLPWFVLSLWFSFWFPLSEGTLTILDKLSKVIGIFRFINSAVNPVLYTFFKRDFLDAFKQLFIKKRSGNFTSNYTMITQNATLVHKPGAYCGHREGLDRETVM